MRRQFLHRSVCAICLLGCLGLVRLGAGDGTWQGDSAQDMKNMASLMSEDVTETEDNAEKVLIDMILQVFKDQGCYTAKLRKVSWGPEELPDRLWEQMAQWQEEYKEYPRKFMGYIELLGEPSGEAEEGFLWEYATVQHRQYQDTYLVTNLGIFEIRSRGEHDSWRACMQKLLCSIGQWQITGEEAEQYVHELNLDWDKRYADNPPDNQLELWYQGINFSFYGEDEKLLAYRTDREYDPERYAASGRECLWLKQNYYGREMEWQICTAETVPAFASYRELRKYLQTLHPDMWDCMFYGLETGEYIQAPIAVLRTDEAEYAYYCQEGQWYQFRIPREAGDREDAFYWSDSRLYYDLEYSHWDSYRFHITEQGYVTEGDLTQNSYYLEEETGPGQIFSFDCKMAEAQKGELLTNYTYEIAVSVLGAEESFQILEASSAEWYPFSFEDFNSDGFKDLRVDYYYGANGGTAAHYIWSPSRGEFVRGPEELEYYGQYGIDPEKRRLSIHYHGSAVCGSENLYQWSGEMDCEQIRHFYHDAIYDDDLKEYTGMLVNIQSYENGQEKILSEYIYPMEEYMERDAIWEIYSLDFVWEREVVLEGQENPCILRYAQENEENYQDYLFLFREDTYLICTLEKQEAPAAYADITWDEENQWLAVDYEYGATHYYQWNGEEFRNIQYFCFEEEISPGQIFSFDCRGAETGENDAGDEILYQVAVSVSGKEKPFQIFEAESAMKNIDGERGVFSFEDFNADGYQDLNVLYYYGANGGSAAHYIWSPTKGMFVKAPEALEGYSSYSVDQEKRQLYIHMHESAAEGSEYLYQWSGEMDCELRRFYDYRCVYDDDGDITGMHEKISSFENGREKVLSDYIYPIEECMEEGLYEMYLLDFVWEREIDLTEQEQNCILRYAQVELDGEADEKYYLDFLYLFREDTYLICRLRGQEAPAAYADIVWEEENRRLTVNYEDGAIQYYQWDGKEFSPETGEPDR